MSSENTLTGRNGHHSVGGTNVARSTDWDVTKTLVGGSEWGDSDSEGFTNVSPGRKKATFNSNGKYDTTSEVYDLFQPEDIAASILYLNASTLYWSFPRAMCNNFTMAVNMDTEEVIGWGSSWTADGVFYFPGES